MTAYTHNPGGIYRHTEPTCLSRATVLLLGCSGIIGRGRRRVRGRGRRWARLGRATTQDRGRGETERVRVPGPCVQRLLPTPPGGRGGRGRRLGACPRRGESARRGEEGGRQRHPALPVRVPTVILPHPLLQLHAVFRRGDGPGPISFGFAAVAGRSRSRV